MIKIILPRLPFDDDDLQRYASRSELENFANQVCKFRGTSSTCVEWLSISSHWIHLPSNSTFAINELSDSDVGVLFLDIDYVDNEADVDSIADQLISHSVVLLFSEHFGVQEFEWSPEWLYNDAPRVLTVK